MTHRLTTAGLIALSFCAFSAHAQSLPYGVPISLDVTKKAVQAAAAEMRKNKWEMTIAVVDSGGNLVYLERADQAGLGTIEPALGKAKAANGIKVPTAVIGELIVNQKLTNLIAVPGAFPVAGGVPLIVNGRVIGAMGASGGMPADDAAVANAGAKSLLPD
jgi:glc operon protein GlcG